MALYYPFAEYWWFYGTFILFVVAMLALDLGVFHKDAHEVSIKEATTWSLVWIGCAMVFAFGFYQYNLWRFAGDAGVDGPAIATELTLEFLTGFVVEKALAVDNIFVFVVVFSFFGIPAKYQHRVLFFGIIGALVFRAMFIALGAVLMQYHLLVVLFGIFLIVTGVKVMFAPEKPIDPSTSPLIRFLKQRFPVTDRLDGDHFFTIENGKRAITPLFLALAFVEVCDIIFAVDSVPAIFALTDEPLIVFTSNIFAILGLRSLYFLLAGVVDKFYLLKYALGVVLIFVGLKMSWLNSLFGGKFPLSWSLGIIAATLTVGLLLSILIPKKEVHAQG